MSEIKEAVNNIAKIDVAMAAKNDSDDTFELGGKTFKLLDLRYDDYIEFVELMAPFLTVIFSAQSGAGNSGFDIQEFIRTAGYNLPKMVFLMVHTQDKEITVDIVKEMASTPYQLANIAVKQIVKNKMIADFTSFFESMTQVMSGLL